MKRNRDTGGQIACALPQAGSGTVVEEICRKLGFFQPTFCRWKKQIEGMGVVEIRRLKQIEKEHAKAKGTDAVPNAVRPAVRREVARHLQDACRGAEWRACSTTEFRRS